MSGFISGRLDRIGEYMQRTFIEPGKIAGCQVIVARGGEIGLSDQWGFADVERERPITSDTIFRTMSNTKAITATAAMALFEEGRFRLDDPLKHHLPGWRDQRVWVSGRGRDMITEPLGRPVTIRDVLRHTAGLTYGSALQTPPAGVEVHPVDEAYQELRVDLGRNVPMAEFIDRISQVPLRYQPGQGWMYSMASDVVGALVEAVSGQPFDEFLKSRILDPLGMRDTAFHVPDEKLNQFSASYRPGRDQQIVLHDDPETSVYRKKPVFSSGGGGLVGTASDYFRFCEMIRRGGELDGVRVLSPRTVRMMCANHLPDGRDIASMSEGLFVERGNDGVGYGLGFATTFDPIKSGSLADNDVFWGGLHSTLFWIDPVADLTVVFMTQLFPARTYDFRGPLRSLVYSALTE